LWRTDAGAGEHHVTPTGSGAPESPCSGDDRIGEAPVA
jgi:hypothetical protein